MNKLEKKYIIKRENLNEEHYFQSILQQADEMKLLTDAQLESIKLQSIQLLAKQIEGYTSGNSSSVRVETAQSIMLSIFYSIGVFLKSFTDIDRCITEIKEKSVSELYLSGRLLIDKQLTSAKKLLKAVHKISVETNNQAYNDTLGTGIEIFFSSYDADFAAHDTPASIDYPLCNDKMNLVGIEYINSYLYKLLLENQFCQNFSSHKINCLLHGYDEHCEDLIINIFERVLTNALGCILIDKSVVEINIQSEELPHLQQKLESLSKEKLDVLLTDISAQLFTQLNISNLSLQEYILETVKHVSVSLKNALENHQLKAVFVSLKENDTKSELQFEDGAKMDDELFQKISDEIGECCFVSEKIAIIQKNVHSIIDLVDVFEASYIYDEEFNDIFELLGDVQLAVLLKMLQSNRNYLELDDIECENEWQSRLICYLKGIEIDRSNHIRELCDTIKLS